MGRQRAPQSNAVQGLPRAGTFERASSPRTYQYCPLNEEIREFRLLQVLPLPESFQAPLRCRLICASFEQGQEVGDYEAISYCWGNPTPSSAIEIDGTILNLPVNSEKALRRLAFPDRKRTVFLDAVCINQADWTERSSQVQLMGDVYRNAQATLVYLGDVGTTASLAFASIRLLHRELQEDYDAHDGLLELTMRAGSQSSSRHPPRSPVNSDALLELCQNPWFRRIWIFQEIVLAKKAVVVWGAEETDMLPILDVAWWLMNCHRDHISRTLKSTLTWPGFIFRARRNVESLTFLQLLHQSLHLEATNPKDKVYGMLGLLDQAVVKKMTIDYTKSFAHVCRDAARQCLADPSQPFGLFSEKWPRDRAELFDRQIPSWAHRLDRSGLEGFTPTLLSSHGGTAGEMVYANMAADAIDEPDVLILKGLEICSIMELSDTLDWRRGPRTRSSWIHKAVRMQAKHHDTLGWQEGPRSLSFWIHKATGMLEKNRISDQALARTLVANTTHNALLSSESYHEALMKIHPRDLPAWKEIDSDARESLEPLLNYSEAIFHACNYRRFAIMNNGTTALVPKLAEVGDRAVMMHGAFKPFALKPYRDGYLMLGECYVDGWMMWQENVDLIQRGMEWQSKDFRIY